MKSSSMVCLAPSERKKRETEKQLEEENKKLKIELKNAEVLNNTMLQEFETT